MNTKQTPAPQAERSGCAAWFILLLASIGMATIVIGMLVGIWKRPGEGVESIAIGQAFPDLNLTPITINEKPVTLADLSGKVTLINFWATWCDPCRAELPEIAEIGEELKNKEDFVLLPVSCGHDDPTELSIKSLEMLQDMDLDMPCYSDPTGATQLALASITNPQERGLPTTLILDRKGIVRGMWVGYLPGQGKEMLKLIAKLLFEKPQDEKPEK
jgi:thiol-disulfide isomerase/thioredoxin